MANKVYRPSRTASAFHAHGKPFKAHDRLIKMMVGPVGSGSSTACIMDRVMATMAQPPDAKGVRRRRVVTGRSSYPKLKTSVLPTAKNWLGGEKLEVKGQSPIVLKYSDKLGDGTMLELEFWLMSFDDPSPEAIEDQLSSVEFTDMWLNEAKELPAAVLENGIQRIGRYPAVDVANNFKGAHQPTLLLDTNQFDTDNYLYKFFFQSHAGSRQYRAYLQPGALMEASSEHPDARYCEHLNMFLVENPRAENIDNLLGGYDYYWNIMKVSPESVPTRVMNQFGVSHSGMPVYSSRYFSRDKHISASHIEFAKGFPLIIGIDWGVEHAAFVFCQYINATLYVLDELVIKDLGVIDQMELHVIPKLNTQFIGHSSIILAVDPAGKAREPVNGRPLYTLVEEMLNADVVLRDFKNQGSARFEAVKQLLGRKDGLLLNQSAEYLIKGFAGQYAYKVTPNMRRNGEVHGFRPIKNEFSHPHDALQYVALTVTSDLSAIQNVMDRETEMRNEWLGIRRAQDRGRYITL